VIGGWNKGGGRMRWGFHAAGRIGEGSGRVSVAHRKRLKKKADI